MYTARLEPCGKICGRYLSQLIGPRQGTLFRTRTVLAGRSPRLILATTFDSTCESREAARRSGPTSVRSLTMEGSFDETIDSASSGVPAVLRTTPRVGLP